MSNGSVSGSNVTTPVSSNTNAGSNATTASTSATASNTSSSGSTTTTGNGATPVTNVTAPASNGSTATGTTILTESIHGQLYVTMNEAARDMVAAQGKSMLESGEVEVGELTKVNCDPRNDDNCRDE